VKGATLVMAQISLLSMNYGNCWQASAFVLTQKGRGKLYATVIKRFCQSFMECFFCYNERLGMALSNMLVVRGAGIFAGITKIDNVKNCFNSSAFENDSIAPIPPISSKEKPRQSGLFLCKTQ
jgi:hypothetical protein